MNRLSKVLDNLRHQSQSEEEQQEEVLLKESQFDFCKTVVYGLPHKPRCLAYDPMQRLLAIGTEKGRVRVLGQPGVDFGLEHPSHTSAVSQILFLVNEGALITICADDSLHMWNFRQRFPKISLSSQFQRENLARCHVSLASKWLLCGTKRGNIYILSTETFQPSGYVIYWNKAVGQSVTTNPGSVDHLSDCPEDNGKLLIGFSGGLVALWDLRLKEKLAVFASSEPRHPGNLTAVAWHNDGKQFMCAHGNGSLVTWDITRPQQPVKDHRPHSGSKAEEKDEPCRSINSLDWRALVQGEPLVIFTGGTKSAAASCETSLSIMQGGKLTLLQLEGAIVDMLVLSSSPYAAEIVDPFAVVLLLENDVYLFDLTKQPGFPWLEVPYSFDIHETSVESCIYISDSWPELIPSLYTIGMRQKQATFSSNNWPINGGRAGTQACSYCELIVTGHASGDVKFWDASGICLQVLYLLKSTKALQTAEPAIKIIQLHCQGEFLLLGARNHVLLYKLSRVKGQVELHTLNIELNISNSGSQDDQSPSGMHVPTVEEPDTTVGQTRTLPASSGYQCELACITPHTVTAVNLSPACGMLALGCDTGIAIIDVVQKTCVLRLSTADMYGSLVPLKQNRVTKLLKEEKIKDKDKADKTLSNEDTDLGISDDPFLSKVKGGSVATRTASTTSAGASLKKRLERKISARLSTSSKSNSVCEEDVTPPLSPGIDTAGFSVFDQRYLDLPTPASGRWGLLRIVSTFGIQHNNNHLADDIVTHVTFFDTHTQKQAPEEKLPSLWIGTQLGSVLIFSIQLDELSDERSSGTPVISPNLYIFRLGSPILLIKHLDAPCPVGQLVLLVSETTVQTVNLPSGNKLYKVSHEQHTIKVANAATYKDAQCLFCLLSSGEVVVYSTPRLVQLFRRECLAPLTVRVHHTLTFGDHAQLCYLISPSEIQKASLSSEMGTLLGEMLGELFLPREMPEPPKKSFLRTWIFSSPTQELNREQLFGGTDSKQPYGVVKPLEREGVHVQAASSEISRAKDAILERGEKLQQVELQTERMAINAQAFSERAATLAKQQKDKKWYQV